MITCLSAVGSAAVKMSGPENHFKMKEKKKGKSKSSLVECGMDKYY